MLAAAFTTLLFAVSTVCGSRAAAVLGGTIANFSRLCLATVLLALYAHTVGAGIRGAGFVLFAISGAIGFGVGDMALYQALPRLGSRLSSMMVLCLSSPFAALLEWGWLGTDLSGREIVCGVVILAGVGLALAPGGRLHLTGSQVTKGAGFGLLAALCQAVGAAMSRKAFALDAAAGVNVDGLSAAYQRLLGGIVVAALVTVFVKHGEMRALVSGTRGAGRDWKRAWPWLVANAIAGPALGVGCYQWALISAPSGVVLPIVALTPVVIIPFSWHLEGERPGWRSLAGGVLAVLGAAALALKSQ